MINDTSMLKIVFSAKGETVVDKKWKAQDREEGFARLYYVHSGNATIWHHGQQFDLTPHQIYLIPPKSNMRYQCNNSCEIAWVHFNTSLYGHLDLFKLQDFSFVHIPENHKSIHKQMQEMIFLLEQEDMFSQLRSKSLLLELVSLFFKFQHQQAHELNNDKITRLTPVLNYIDSHLGEQIRLAKLAKLASYEKTYFSTLFKQVFSISPIAYIQNKRIEKAKSLLRNTNAKLEAIAQDLAFKDAFHFSKTFKKITGEPPSEFRKKISQRMP